MNAVSVKVAESLLHSTIAERYLFGTYSAATEIEGLDDFHDPFHARLFETVRQIDVGKPYTVLMVGRADLRLVPVNFNSEAGASTPKAHQNEDPDDRRLHPKYSSHDCWDDAPNGVFAHTFFPSEKTGGANG